MTGGASADRFILRPSGGGNGNLFTKGQQFARITDFNSSEGDVLSLPGNRFDYTTGVTGVNNDSTLILYKENPELDISFGIPGGSVSTGLAVEVPNQTALVAVLDGALARNLENTDIYKFDQPTA